MSEKQLLLKVAKAAFGDLMGISEPPEGMPDNYPFNAPLWVAALPEELRKAGAELVSYVYRYEEIPDCLRVRRRDEYVRTD